MRRPDRLILLPVLALAGLPAARAAEPTPEQKLDAVQHSLEESRKTGETLGRQAKSLDADLAALQAQSVAAAKSAQANEVELTALEKSLAAIEADEARQSAALAGADQREQALLAALERVAATPPGAMIFSSEAPVDAARAAMLLGAAVPQIEAQLKSLADEMENLRQIQNAAAAKRAAVLDRRKSLEADRQRIAQLQQQKQALAGETHAKADAAQKRVALLTAQAADLKQLIDKLARDREEQEARERAAAERKRAEEVARNAAPSTPVAAGTASEGKGFAPGKLLVPAAGEICKKFGDGEEFGTAKGLTICTRAGAQIVAPAGGDILFAGPFKGYGQILIIDHGGGYHSLLAGIGRVGTAVGQHVVAGEPVGTMASDGAPSLYLELRRQGQPVDPLPFLAAHDGKATG